MSLDAAVAAIRTRAHSLWPGLEAAVPLSWPNETMADDGVTPIPAHDGSGNPVPFVTIEVRWSPGGSGFMSIGAPGSNLARRQGFIWAYAFIPLGVGEGRAHQLASEAAHMFEGQDFSGVVCQAMEPGGGVESEDGTYFGQSASVSFNFDETA